MQNLQLQYFHSLAYVVTPQDVVIKMLRNFYLVLQAAIVR